MAIVKKGRVLFPLSQNFAGSHLPVARKLNSSRRTDPHGPSALKNSMRDLRTVGCAPLPGERTMAMLQRCQRQIIGVIQYGKRMLSTGIWRRGRIRH